MYTVYVLKSTKNSKRYVGMTSKELTLRLDWHRWGLTSWTKQNGPFDLIHVEEFSSREEATRREKYLKTGQGRRTLDHVVSKNGSACATERGASATICGGG